MSTSNRDQRCEREIRELHEFFARWYNGALAKDEETFARFAGLLAPDFHIITPDGNIHDWTATLDAVFGSWGRKRDVDSPEAAGPFQIEIRNVELRGGISGEAFIATYEEWQSGAEQTATGTATGRLSTVIMRENAACPNGLEWLHVHETWLPESA